MTDTTTPGTTVPRTRGLPLAFVPLALTYLAVAVNMTVTSVALPTISTDLEATSDQLVWIVNITPLASAALLLFAGAWGDRYGRRRLLLAGLVIFTVSAALSAVAQTPNQLIALRAVTGVGSALTMPAALALTFAVVAGPSRRTAVGFISATQAVGSLLGPILAGSALVLFSWGAAFLSVVPLLLVALLLAWVKVPKDSAADRGSTPLDSFGAALMALFGTSLLYAAVTLSSVDPGRGRVLTVALAVAVVAGVGLVLWERRAHHPLFVGAVMRSRTFWVPTFTIFMVQFVLGGVMFLNTQYVQLALGFDAFTAGVFLLPALGMWIATSASAGLTARFLGLRAVVGIGLAAAAIGLLIVSTAGLSPRYAVLILGLLLVGCMGVAPALMTHLAVSSYPDSRRTVGSAINSVAVRFGLAFGIAAFGATMTATYASALQPQLASLDPSRARLAESSLGGALQVATGLSREAGTVLERASREAFVSGFNVTLVAAAVILGIVTVIAVIWMPETRVDEAPAERGAST